jgi:hypothetical protein
MIEENGQKVEMCLLMRRRELYLNKNCMIYYLF